MDGNNPTVARLKSPGGAACRLVAVAVASMVLALAGCTDEGTGMFNCYLASDVPPVVVREASAAAANRKCEKEQGQKCTCTEIRGYRTLTDPAL